MLCSRLSTTLCNGQVITVISANYGRRDRTTCSSGRPSSQVQKVDCSRPTNHVAESCNGRSSCAVEASNTIFGDPCGGTYKYLEVVYTCQSNGQVITVISANYGRRDRTTCSSGRPSSQVQKVDCSRPTNHVAESCNGRSSCAVEASNTIFGDPCGGTYKYLEVVYTCQSNGQVITVISANYGRRDRTTCSSGRPSSQVQKVDCSRPTNHVAQSCNGRSSCAVEASNTIFGDPCGGTYKYLEVVYTCQSNGQVITVISANYGRRDRTTCSSGRPSSQVQKVDCSRPTNHVAESCNGRSSCAVEASNTIFGDPCGGTYKYLEVVYTCQSNGQVITVISANYGRRDRTTCSSGRPSHQVQKVDCSRPTNYVAESCNGRSSCAVEASNTIFGDPCYGTYKYLEVVYTCQIKIQNVHCSDSTSKVSKSCNGKDSCIIKASNSVFGDPCVGTYKYLEVAYTCQYPV
ncbi:L-rhamnose-binding lectin CSL3 [Larimichthys crocea]|uniref:L-rhamnose-binding lectin CSL3 n=1 Tax=Larimichthys crocea TaxID=215358 RepID=A0A6G0IN72_LARCR|nr:L-rhamnose-binding lectin CSL3 [Larimichthys crocea]